MSPDRTSRGLTCPSCDSVRIKTLDTRARGQTIRRRKQCKNCGTAFFTREFSEVLIPDDARFDAIFVAPEQAAGSCGRVR